jgi:hypothetical protein
MSAGNLALTLDMGVGEVGSTEDLVVGEVGSTEDLVVGEVDSIEDLVVGEVDSIEDLVVEEVVSPVVGEVVRGEADSTLWRMFRMKDRDGTEGHGGQLSKVIHVERTDRSWMSS